MRDVVSVRNTLPVTTCYLPEDTLDETVPEEEGIEEDTSVSSDDTDYSLPDLEDIYEEDLVNSSGTDMLTNTPEVHMNDQMPISSAFLHDPCYQDRHGILAPTHVSIIASYFARRGERDE